MNEVKNNMEKLVLESKYDLYPIYVNVYPVENPKGIVQIVHGMKEHQLRYADFASFLNANGYTVYTSDLRGHGPNASLLGHMEGKKPWKALVADQATIAEHIKRSHPSLSLNLFAHSMGTIISRNLIQQYADYFDKIILSGVPGYQAATPFAILLANMIGLFQSDANVSKFLDTTTNRKFEKAIKDAKSPADWVSISQTNLEKYLSDPYCNFPFSISAYKALYHLVYGMHKSKRYHVTMPHKPILMIIGREDPCPLGEKGLKHSMKTLRKAGYNNISYKIYDNMRHEILNEDNHQIVYEGILNFLN